MTEYDSTDLAFFCVDGHDLLAFSAKLDDQGARLKSVDRTAIADAVERSVILNQIEAMTLPYEGWFDDEAAIGLALDGSRGVEQLLSYGVEGNVLGADFVGMRGVQTLDKPITKGDLIRVSAAWELDKYERGKIIAPLAVRGAAGNTQATPVDNLVATSAGAVCYLQMPALALGGYTNVIVKVRDSIDGVTWADIVTFTARTAAGAQRVEVAGNVDRRLAISWAYTGAGADPAPEFLVGVARN